MEKSVNNIGGNNTRSGIINVNIGILGHVDSGKTSLVKTLSTALSTAALDKNPQSQQRGITLDLGFSSFTMSMPEHLQRIHPEYANHNTIQYTLVDCPGHASLLRTIISGAQIIDMVVLVVDVNKGIQTQTAECIVLAEITTNTMIVALNKIDLLPPEERDSKILRMTEKLTAVFATTKFRNLAIIPIAASVGGEKVAAVSAISTTNSKTPNAEIGVANLINTIQTHIALPQRAIDANFYYAIDHCFAIKGHGTVLTGTVLSGSVSINQTIEIPELQLQRKVKSMQMFRKPVTQACQGDRVGICVTNLDPTLIERAIAVKPGSVPRVQWLVCRVRKIRFFRGSVRSSAKLHVTVGHSTVQGSVLFFGGVELLRSSAVNATTADAAASANGTSNEACAITSSSTDNNNTKQFDRTQDYTYQDEILAATNLKYNHEPPQYAFIQLQSAIFCPLQSLLIASKLDVDTHDATLPAAQQCRLAFYGPIVDVLPVDEAVLPSILRVFQLKHKTAKVFKVTDVVSRGGAVRECLGSELVSASSGSVQAFLGLKIETSRGVVGVVAGAFGAEGKFKVKFPGSANARLRPGDTLTIIFKRYYFDKSKQMSQHGMYTNVVEDDVDAGAGLTDKKASVSGDISCTINYSDISKSPTTPTTIANTRINMAKTIAEQQPIAFENQTTNAKHETSPVATGHMAKMTTVRNHADIGTSKSAYSSLQQQSPSSTTISTMKAIDAAPPPPLPSTMTLASTFTSTSAPQLLKSPTPVFNQRITRVGVIDSLKDETTLGFQTAIVSGAFKMEENIRDYINNNSDAVNISSTSATGSTSIVIGPNGESGEIIAPFGKLGKCKVRFPTGCLGPVGAEVKIIFS